MMKFASGFAALAAASECGPTVVIDGYFPAESRASYHTYTEVSYADHFDITYADTFKVLNNFAAKEQYVLTMCNNEAPKAEAVDAVAPLKEGFTRKSFSVPLKSYGSDSTATLAFLDIIDVHDRQLYISEYATAPCLQKSMGCDADMKAASAWGDADAQALRKEQISKTEGFFLDNADATPNTIAIATHLDPHMLNRAEWIKFVAAFFNKEDVAEKHMTDQAATWEKLSTEAKAKEKTPLVAFINNDNWGGVKSISRAAYKTLLVEAAGGKSFAATDFSSNAHAVVDGLTIKFNASKPEAVAAFQAALKDVAVLIDETYEWNPPDYNAAKFSTGFGFDGAGAKIFRVDGLLGGTSGTGLDWFEGSFARPAVVLADFVAAMHATGTDTTYLRTLEENPTVMTAADCKYEVPACNKDVTPAPIEAPYDRYTKVDTKVAGSASVAAALLIVAAAFA